MNALTQSQGYLFLLLFAIVMFALTYFLSRKQSWTASRLGFLKAGAKIPWTIGAFSIAASWIWAPALFVSVQKTFELGMPGLLWFTVPNIFALVMYVWLAPKIREKIPGGYTLPDWIKHRFQNKTVHKLYLIIYIWYQVMAVTVQVFVGGLLVSYLTGIPLNGVMILLALVGLSYSLLSGLRASIITDFLQMALIIGIGLVIVPWVSSAGGGWDAIQKGFGGLANNSNVFDLNVAYSFGIVTTLGLLSGAICDQQYWQRSFSIKRTDLKKAFLIGGLIFGLIPIGLSVLGFLGANPDLGITMPQGVQLPMIGVEVVGSLLPTWAMILFVIMLLSGLSSTLDSGLVAGASLWAIDGVKLTEQEKEVYRKERLGQGLNDEEILIRENLDKKTPIRARSAMVGLAVIGLLVALAVRYIPGFGLDKLWWVFNGVATIVVVPTVLSVFWDKLSAKGVLLGFIGSFIGIIAFIYGNAQGNTDLIVGSSLFIIVISLVMNLAFPLKEPFNENAHLST